MKKFNLLKHLALLLVALSFAFNASADDCLNKYMIGVWEFGDRMPVAEFRLEYGATVTFNEGQIIITNDVADIIFERNLDEVWKLTYRNFVDPNPSSIQSIVDDVDGMKYDGNVVMFPSLKAGSNIAVFAANGMVLINKSITTDGEYSLPLTGLSQGVYIVNVNGKTFKIVKK